MTAAEFRRLALSLPDAGEGEHMSHPDFRVGGRIFATMGYPDDGYGMVKLFPDQQQEFVAAAPQIFTPVKCAWGRQGCTSVLLQPATKERVREALKLAWERAASQAKNGRTLTTRAERPGRSRRRQNGAGAP